jgi:cyclase
MTPLFADRRAGENETITLGSVHEVAPAVFAYVQGDGSWYINNAGFVVDDNGVTLIDTCASERRTTAYIAAIRRVTPRPIQRLLLTHHHRDHTNGNGLVGASTIFGHEGTRERLVNQAPSHLGPDIIEPIEFGAVAPMPPDVTFSERLVVDAGGRDLVLSYAGQPAHTDNDVTVWLPDAKVLFAGDLVMRGSMPLAAGGSVAGILAVLDRVRRLQPEVVVPGHGEVGGPDLIDQMIRYYSMVRRLALVAIADQLTPLRAARAADLGEFAGMLNPERIVANLRRAMLEAGATNVGPMTEALMFAEMRDFNGGPLRCVA